MSVPAPHIAQATNRLFTMKSRLTVIPATFLLLAAFMLSVTSSAFAGTLSSGQSLQTGQRLQSDNRRYTLTLQSDGNVVLYDHHHQAIWATNTPRSHPANFAMQTDGNLVLYASSGGPIWASNTNNNPGAFLVVQDDGNLVVYRAGAPTTPDNALSGHQEPTGDNGRRATPYWRPHRGMLSPGRVGGEAATRLVWPMAFGGYGLREPTRKSDHPLRGH
jgi:hypothetical protein